MIRRHEMERLIFRTEHGMYPDATDCLAVFPDAPANPGRLAYAAFRLFEYCQRQ